MFKITRYHCRICGNVNEKCAPCFQYPEYDERCNQKLNAKGTYFRLCSKHFEPRLWRQQSDQKFYLTDDNANPITLVDRKILANLLLPIISPKIIQKDEYCNRAYVFTNYATEAEFLVKPFKIKISRCDFTNYGSNEVLMKMPQKVSTVDSNTAELLKQQYEVKSIQICLANYKDLKEKLKYKVISNDKFVEAPYEENFSLPEVQVKVVRIEMSRLKKELSKYDSKETTEWRRTHVVAGSKSKSYTKIANRNAYWKVQFRTSLSTNDVNTLENGKDVAVTKEKKTSQEKRTCAKDYKSQSTMLMAQGGVDLVSNNDHENHKNEEVTLSKSMFVIVDDWIKVAAKMPQLENTGMSEERILTQSLL